MNEMGLAHLGAVPAVLAVARLGSATAAARALGVGPSTVLRRIEALEDELDVRLFVRTPAGLEHGDHLPLLLPWLERIEAAALEVVRGAQQVEREVAGTVRIAVLPTVASRMVVPAVPALRARHPDLRVELVAADGLADLTRLEADLALRVVQPTQPALIARRLSVVDWAIVGAPGLLSAHSGAPLAALPWLDWVSGSDPHRPEIAWTRRHVPDAAVVFRALDMESLIEAAKFGVGVVLLPEAVAAAAGGLERWRGDCELPAAGGLWLATHATLRAVPRVAAAWTWLVESFDAALRSGRVSLP